MNFKTWTGEMDFVHNLLRVLAKSSRSLTIIYRRVSWSWATLLLLSACTPPTENPFVLTRLSGVMETAPTESHQWSVGAELRTVFPIRKYTLTLDETIVDKDGLLSSRDIAERLEIPPGSENLVLRITSRHGTDFRTITIPKDWESGDSQPEMISMIPNSIENKNLLGNSEFDDFNKNISLWPWEFDSTDDEGPRIAGRLDDAGRGGWMLELLPRSDGNPTRVWQSVALAQMPDKGGQLEASVRIYADVKNEANFEVLLEYDGNLISLGSVWHPGGSEWRTLSLSATVPPDIQTAELYFRVESRASLPDRVLMDAGKLSLLGSFPRIGGIVDIIASGPLSQVTRPLTIPDGAELSFGIAIGQAFDRLPTGSATFVVTVEEAGNRREVFRDFLTYDNATDTPRVWKDCSVDLSPWSGRSVRLVFDVEVNNSVTQTKQSPERWTLPLWGDVVMTASQKRSNRQKPNIILISLDTLRADRLGSYGYERDTSPNLDRFAKESYLFEQCYAPTSWTTPSHASVFTGQLPSVHGAGVRRGVGNSRSLLPNRVNTLAEIAAGVGMRTAAYTEGYFAGFRWGLGQGFDRYSDGSTDHIPSTRNVETTIARAQDWIRERGKDPFFMFVHTYAAHWPYDAPSPLGSRFVMDSNVTMPSGDAVMSGDLDPAQIELLSSLYDGGIAYLDQVLGRFLGFLRDEGLFENSVVIIFSDHGEEFGEHGGAMHGFTLYNEVLHVPLMIRMPGSVPEGGRIKELVALTDIYATVLDLLEVEDIELPVTSVSLVPHIEGTSEMEPRTVWGELVHHDRRQMLLSAHTASEKYIAAAYFGRAGCVFPGSSSDFEKAYKLDSNIVALQSLSDRSYVNFSEDCTYPKEELYILPGDRTEIHDVAEHKPDRLAAARRRVLDALIRIKGSTASIDATELAEPLTPEEIEGLKALGYGN